MALRNERLAFVGCGVMAEAMVKGLLREQLVEPQQVVASHPREDRRAELESRYGICTTSDNAAAVADATVVSLTVKPQYLDEVLDDLGGKMRSDCLVVTIVAGVRLERITEALGCGRVVRAMPNTPGQIGEGITVWTATDDVDGSDRSKVKSILSALGQEEYVTHENELDMATALSGTGPAYVFLFMEALIDAGVHMGFSRRVATRLVLETVRGSVDYAEQSPDHLAKLRNQVTSPGGTTAEAHYQLEKGRMRTVLSDAVWAAYRRCVQLGRQQASDANGRPF